MQKFLVIGLGSMGKRRLRCLNALGHHAVYGFDSRGDRKTEAKNLGANIINDVEAVMKQEKPICIISVPPDQHLHYMKLCAKYNCHFFVEASVILEGMPELTKELKATNLIAAPSCTLSFHPAIQKLQEIVETGRLGKISNIIYHSGQYLPDWHPYEKVSDFYVSKKDTGGCREIVPFELTWLCKIFGFPTKVFSVFNRTIEIQGASEIDDTYNLACKFKEGFLMSLVVDVVSRYATRRLLINGSEAQLRWDWENDYLELWSTNGLIEKIQYKKAKAHEGYNVNIGEDMYVDEIANFLDAIAGKAKYKSSLDYDIQVLQTLLRAEQCI